MVYTQMLFALFFDKIVWNSMPGLWGLLGSAMILGSALYVAVSHEENAMVRVRDGSDEEAALMEEETAEQELGMDVVAGERGWRSRRGVQAVQLSTIRV